MNVANLCVHIKLIYIVQISTINKHSIQTYMKICSLRNQLYQICNTYKIIFSNSSATPFLSLFLPNYYNPLTLPFTTSHISAAVEKYSLVTDSQSNSYISTKILTPKTKKEVRLQVLLSSVHEEKNCCRIPEKQHHYQLLHTKRLHAVAC